MKCPNCRTEMTVQAETYRYNETGLDVVLLGLNVGRCQNCGEHSVRIPNMDGLHECLATSLVGKKGRLSGNEIRFLRTYMGWSGRTFAQKVAVSPSTVSRWESGAQNASPQVDALLRSFVMLGKKERDYIEAQSAPPPAEVLRFRMKMHNEDWQQEPKDQPSPPISAMA
jgi:putative zinc finger/helix-turn-helix YgiT family protein